MMLNKALEFILNEAIRLDEGHGAAFKPLEDKVFTLTLNDLGTTSHLLFTAYGVSVQSDLQGDADATIETSLVALLALPQTSELKGAVFHGDEPLAEQFVDALNSLEIDWEEHLSHYTGDLIAFKVGHAARSVMQTKQGIKQQAGDTLKEYLQFEINALPTKSQVQRFNQQVVQIHQSVDALENRIDTLLKSATTASH
ncbi:SCP2 sterol-binding domain-containing protein [Thiomicrorhabdus sp. ZW0627]|uniref:ubiquinone biosynthesis accessory factor UbiJ n=1 Tax=Thiomicrorhabdus sp. ZW0627 TaxID=3039774 RepID=UPI002436B423|nr:SCP2 sterol-binding domain-containing protein [Thiomicrorhabdus sp. ZW0627]MDG6773649.1 SCP2 sterol-binding domain-containing protein [Thiomicrorhabdus sp. ZW0627]